jgi:Gram-negative bacterial TonB protein C-terminal
MKLYMNTLFTLLLALLQTGSFMSPRLVQTPALEYPFTTTGTQWVVLDLETNRQGGVQSVQVLQGASPFLEIVLSNLRRWEFTPAEISGTQESHVTVIFVFRPRDIYSGPPVLLSHLYRRNSDSGPFPVQLSDPGYPVNSVGEGLTILDMQLTESGSIGDVRIVRDTPGLARHTENVVRTWKFLPAMRNRAVSNGSVIVVAWYLRPILFNNPPDVGGAYYPYEPSQPAIFRDGGPKPRGF